MASRASLARWDVARGIARSFFVRHCGKHFSRRWAEGLADELKLVTACRTVEAVVPDFGEMLRQDMKEEPRDESLGRQSAALDLGRAVVAVAKGDEPGFETFDARVGDRATEDVSGEIFEDLLASAGVLGDGRPTSCSSSKRSSQPSQ